MFFFSLSLQASETKLVEDCRKRELISCEKLAELYFSRSDWKNAFLISEALCQKESAPGCLIAGSSLLAQGQIKEGKRFLEKACDKFEPLACRSLGRLLLKADEKDLANMNFRRACHFGLKDLCSDYKNVKLPFSQAALTLLEQLQNDCKDTKSTSCTSHFNTIAVCEKPLASLDCQLLAGHLTVYFRARMLQEEAKLLLLTLHSQEKKLKETLNPPSYSYNLSLALKETEPLQRANYVYGFKHACTKKYVLSRKATSLSLETSPKAYSHLSTRTKANVTAYFKKGSGDDCYSSKVGYEAYAVANLDPLNPTRLDVWRIDQDQRLTLVQDGLPLP